MRAAAAGVGGSRGMLRTMSCDDRGWLDAGHNVTAAAARI
jgi:hypothetical protein